MKNLNRKLSVIALSGMAAFGGVAVSGVQAFAAGGVAVKQEVQDELIEKLNREINKANFSYKVLSVHENKQDAKDAMNRDYNNSSRLNGYAPLVKGGIGKYLKKFANSKARVFVLGFGGKWCVVGLPDLLK